MKKHSSIRFLLIVLAIVICATATRAQSVVTNLPESDAVVTVNVRRIVNETLPRLLTAEQMSGVQSALAKAKKIAGFDVSNIDTAVVGLRLNRNAPLAMPSMLLVMRGSFNADALVSLVKIGLAGKARDEKYGAKTLTLLKLKDVMPSGGAAATSPAVEIAIVALDGGTLAAGSPAYVKAAVDADTGKNRIRPELVQMVGREANSLIAIAGLVPQGLFASILPKEIQGNEEIARLAGSIEQIYIGLNMDAQGFPLSVMLKANTVENAHAITGFLQTIAQFGTNVADKNVKPIVDALKITSQETEVQVRTVLPQEIVASFVRGLFSSAAKPAEPKSAPKPETKKP
ncbi:MAG: hypothetical protein V7641_2720 [Blastocatellia bacterium]